MSSEPEIGTTYARLNDVFMPVPPGGEPVRTLALAFNINDYVMVQITPDGHDALARRYAERFAGVPYQPAYERPLEDAEGWSRWQLWELMANMGPEMHLGGVEMIGVEIRICLGKRE